LEAGLWLTVAAPAADGDSPSHRVLAPDTLFSSTLALKELFDSIRAEGFQTLFKASCPEFKHFNDSNLSSVEKAKLVGYILGKYGTEIGLEIATFMGSEGTSSALQLKTEYLLLGPGYHLWGNIHPRNLITPPGQVL
jgi:hypothetical protein